MGHLYGRVKIKKGDTLLVNACGSAIGRIFAQYAQILGFRLIAITRNDQYSNELQRLGASYVINTSTAPLRETIMALTDGKGADAAVDSIGGMAGNDLAFCIRQDGVFLSLGLLSGVQVDWGKINAEAKVQAKLFHLRHWNSRVSVKHWQSIIQHLLTLVENKN